MTQPAAPDWAEIRRLYVETDEPVAAIATRLGTTTRKIHARRLTEAWPARSERRPARRSARKIARRQRAKPARSKRPRRRRKHGPLLIHRLYDAMLRKIEQMEERMSEGKPPSPADNERDTRALANLFRHYEKVKEIDAELARAGTANAAALPAAGAAGDPASSTQSKSGAAAAPIAATGDGLAVAADTERLRRELAERIERLRRRTGA